MENRSKRKESKCKQNIYRGNKTRKVRKSYQSVALHSAHPLLPLLALYFHTLSCLTLCYFTLFFGATIIYILAAICPRSSQISFVTLYKPEQILITVNIKFCDPSYLSRIQNLKQVAQDGGG